MMKPHLFYSSLFHTINLILTLRRCLQNYDMTNEFQIIELTTPTFEDMCIQLEKVRYKLIWVLFHLRFYQGYSRLCIYLYVMIYLYVILNDPRPR
jgi:hypothetical protein